MDYPDEFQDAMESIVDVTYAESEGQDFRVDFGGGYSLWLRNMAAVEGGAPKKLKVKLDELLASLRVNNNVRYT